MAARLQWDGDDLMLGKFVLCTVRKGGVGWRAQMPLMVGDVTHQSIDDCRQDAESEVRRLLKEAGCEVES